MRRALFLLLLILSACAKPPAPVWTELPSTDTLLARFRQTTGRVESLDAAASVGLTVEGKHLSSQQFLTLKRPDLLRSDVVTGFGQLVLQLASDGTELSVFLNTKRPGRFFRGTASFENIARFTHLPLTGEALVNILLYQPPLIAYRRATVAVDGENLLLNLFGENRQQQLLFNSQLQFVGCRYLTDGELLLDVRYQQLDPTDRFPRKVLIELPREKTKVTLKFSDLQTNIELAADRFRLTPPDGIAVETLP